MADMATSRMVAIITKGCSIPISPGHLGVRIPNIRITLLMAIITTVVMKTIGIPAIEEVTTIGIRHKLLEHLGWSQCKSDYQRLGTI
jgi:hypothetical protein